MLRNVGWPLLPRLVVRLMSIQAQLQEISSLDEAYSSEESRRAVEEIGKAAASIRWITHSSRPAMDSYLERTWKLLDENWFSGLTGPTIGPIASTLKDLMTGRPCE